MDDLDKLLDEMLENTADMIKAKELAQALIDHQTMICDKLGGEGGIKKLARRAIVLQKHRPADREKATEAYTKAANETVLKYMELAQMLASVLEAYVRIPEDKKRFASEMN